MEEQKGYLMQWLVTEVIGGASKLKVCYPWEGAWRGILPPIRESGGDPWENCGKLI